MKSQTVELSQRKIQRLKSLLNWCEANMPQDGEKGTGLGVLRSITKPQPLDVTSPRTAREWFKLLPDDIEKMAVENAEKDNTLDLVIRSLHEAILLSFLFSGTAQGYDFWIGIYKAAKSGEYTTNRKGGK